MRHLCVALCFALILTAALARGAENNWPAVAGEARLWNTYPLDQVTFKSWDGPAKPVEAVRIVAPIGGIGTGQLVATQAGGVKALSVSVTAPEGWPADSVTARFQMLADDKVPQWNWGPTSFLPLLTDKAPNNPVVPIRIIARVPRAAKAGAATARLSVTLEGKKQEVPLNIEVGSFAVPEKGQWLSHFDIYQSPEAVARMYKVALWSTEHWALVEQSLKLMGDYPNHVLWVPLKSSGLNGLTESMLRYQKDGNQWQVDSTRLDRYLELFEKYNGEPASLACFVWGGDKSDVHALRGTEAELARTVFTVTGIDGQPLTIKGFTPEARTLFTAGFDAVRAAVTKRKWKQDCVHIGLAMDPLPSKFFVDLVKEPSRNAPWVRHAHDQARAFSGVPVAYCATARNQADWDGPFWKNPRMIVTYGYGEGPQQGLTRSYAAPGQALGAKLHGLAGPMADFWTGVLWVGGQPTMKMYGQYIFQPGPKGAEHSVHSLSQVEAAQAMEAAYQLCRDGKQNAAQPWLKWCGDMLWHSKRLDWAGHEAQFHPEQLPDMEAAMFKAAAPK